MLFTIEKRERVRRKDGKSFRRKKKQVRKCIEMHACCLFNLHL
jgi:hypothetical protein